jgi:hypothetical protein
MLLKVYCSKASRCYSHMLLRGLRTQWGEGHQWSELRIAKGHVMDPRIGGSSGPRDPRVYGGPRRDYIASCSSIVIRASRSTQLIIFYLQVIGL